MACSTTYAVILAAGAGSRLGGVNKGRIHLDGRPLVARAVDRCREAGIPAIRIVIGAQADRVRPLIPTGDDIAIIEHTDWAQGRTSSLQMGVRHQPQDRHVLLYPVDCYAVSARVIPALIDDADTEPYAARTRWTPLCGEGRGHPILFTGDLVTDLLALAPGSSPRDLFRAVRDIPVTVEDRGIVRGIKTFDDLTDGLRLPID